MEYVYSASICADPEGGFDVFFPDVPEAVTGGATQAEARANAVEALGSLCGVSWRSDARCPCLPPKEKV